MVMSRLDSFIRRMTAQRDCLNWAAKAISAIPGPVLEFGLGNGRTYDHLQEILPGRNIYVFERELRAHAISTPPEAFLILGDIEQTLPRTANRLPEKAALAHIDLGTSNVTAYHALASRIGRPVKELMTTGGLIVSNIGLDIPGLTSLDPPPGVKPGRYFIYRVIR